MNSTIAQHFDAVELRLLESQAVTSYQITRREVVLGDGKLRIKLSLKDGGVAELFEFVVEYILNNHPHLSRQNVRCNSFWMRLIFRIVWKRWRHPPYQVGEFSYSMV